jgi:hypothetical protein
MGAIYHTVNVICYFIYTLNNYARPQNKYELFNLRHAQAQNVIECIFGVLKNRFRILLLAPQYSVEIQSQIPAALAALHNFIQINDPQAKIHLTGNNSDHAPGGFYAGDDSLIVPTGRDMDVEEEQDISDASLQRNRIADNMWTEYQQVLYQRSLAGMEEEETDEESDEGSDDSDIYA